MGGTIEILRVSEEVGALSMSCFEVTPAAGKKMTVLKFTGSAALSQNSVVRLMWDEGGAQQEAAWTIKEEGEMPGQFEFTNLSDGVKKLTLCCDNGEAGPVWMSGYAEVLIE